MCLCCFTDTNPPVSDGKLRLVGGIGPNMGRLEISKNGKWGTVCSRHFDQNAANVACRQMGFSHAIEIIEKLVCIFVLRDSKI